MDRPPLTARSLRALIFDAVPRVFWFGPGQTRAERAAMMDTVPGDAQAAALVVMKTRLLGALAERVAETGPEDRPLLHFMATAEEEDEIRRDGTEDVRRRSADWRLILADGPAGFLCDFAGWPGDGERGAGVYHDRATGRTTRVFADDDGVLAAAYPELEAVVSVYEDARDHLPDSYGTDNEGGPEDDAYDPGRAFDFSMIPSAFLEGQLPVGAFSAAPTAYVDTDLTVLGLATPGGAVVLDLVVPEGAAGAWEEHEETRYAYETLKEGPGASTWFTTRRWSRGLDEELEYWLSDGDDPDLFVALRRGAWFLAVYCICGHPGVVTPAVDWYNTDGSTDAEPLPCGTADELIAAATERAKYYVANQIH